MTQKIGGTQSVKTNEESVMVFEIDSFGQANPKPPTVLVGQEAIEHKTTLSQAITAFFEKEMLPKHVKFEVECLLDYDDCILAMQAYTLNGDLPRTLNEEVTGYLNRLLYTSYNSRHGFWMTHLLRFLKENCRVPYFQLNMT